MDHPLHDRDIDDFPAPPGEERPRRSRAGRVAWTSRSQADAPSRGTLLHLLVVGYFKLILWYMIGVGAIVALVYATLPVVVPVALWIGLAAAVLGNPRPGIAWLLGLVELAGGAGLAVLGVRLGLARWRRYADGGKGKGGISGWRRIPHVLGLSGGPMPRAMRGVLAVGLLAGSAAAFHASAALLRGLDARPGAAPECITLVGAGTVRGTIAATKERGPVEIQWDRGGTLRSSGGSGSYNGGADGRATVHLANRGTVWGQDLVGRSDARGLVLPESEVRWPLYLEGLAGALLDVLLVVACAAIVARRAIGALLLRTWALAFLGWSALLTLWIPTAIEVETWLAHIYPVAVLLVLHRRNVRAYLARSTIPVRERPVPVRWDALQPELA